MSGAIRSFLELHIPSSICREVGDGSAAIEKAKELSCDLIVLDLSLSTNPNGVETALALRQVRPQTKIVGFSTATGKPGEGDLVAANLDAVLTKRDGLAELGEVVRSLLSTTGQG